MLIRVLALAALFGAATYADDITIPLDDGRLVIRDAQFIRLNSYGLDIPELSFLMTNETSSPWLTIRLKFDIGGICNFEVHHWSFTADVGIGYLPDRPMMKTYAETIIPLMRKVDGCKTVTIKASLVIAENSTVRINGVTGERVDLEEELKQITARRETEEAARAEEQRKADEELAKVRAKEEREQAQKKAAETARRKRLAAEQKKKDAEREARIARYRTEQDAKDAEEKRKLRVNCTTIYQNTIDKKVKDLTVREEEQVRACQVLGLYPPR